MIKAIILDWGGVLIDNPVPGFMTYCSDYFGLPNKVFTQATYEFYEDFAKGKITEDAFWEKLCARLNVAKPSVESLLTEAFERVYFERDDVISLVASLKDKGYKLALLSNTEKPMVDCFRRRNYDFFDLTVFSCMEGVIKPDRKIYELTLNKLRINPHEAIFIDDKEENIIAAKAMGINAILFETPEKFKEKLLPLL